MHTFIKTLSTRLSNPGVAHRSQMVFDQAMARGKYRWGRKAKLTAGAAVAVALRESHKSDSLRDISVSIFLASSVVRPTHLFVYSSFRFLDPPRRLPHLTFPRIRVRNHPSSTRCHIFRPERPSRGATYPSRSIASNFRYNLTQILNLSNQIPRAPFHTRNEDRPFPRLADHTTRIAITSPNAIHSLCNPGAFSRRRT